MVLKTKQKAQEIQHIPVLLKINKPLPKNLFIPTCTSFIQINKKIFCIDLFKNIIMPQM